MPVYVDTVHMVADTLEELHTFAERIGIKRCWFEGMRKGHPHYDVVGWRRSAAIRAGAITTDSKTVLTISKKAYEQRQKKTP